MSADHDDPHLWLEEVLGDAPLKWAQERNDECKAHLGSLLFFVSFCLTSAVFVNGFFIVV